jgi:hypothetical protein
MPLIFKYFISACILSFAVNAYGQQKKKEVAPKIDYSPTGIRIGTDLIDIGKSYSGKNFKGWEVNADMGFSNYYLVADIGSWAKDLDINNGHYKNSGNYYRVGVDINFLGKDPDRNMFFLGFRVGHSSFNEALSYQSAPVRLFPVPPVSVSNPHASGGWGEITTGLRVKLWKSLWMGYTARLKLAPGVKSSPNFATYDMPGYGIVQNKPWWGFNYQVFWRFAWKEDKPIIPEKK